MDTCREKTVPNSARRRPKRTPKAPRQAETLLDPQQRVRTGDEVNRGFSPEQAQREALRCLSCVDPKCMQACPLHIDIRRFVEHLTVGDFPLALETILERSPFPGVCGRVCQHERFCEDACLLGTKLQPVAIGSFERFAADLWRGCSCGRRRRATRSASGSGRQRTRFFDRRARFGGERLSRHGF